MKLSKSGESLFIADGKMFIIYSLKKKKKIASYLLSSQVSKMFISNDEKLAYLMKSNKGIKIINILNYNDIKVKSEIMIKGRYSSFTVSKDNKTLYLTGKRGVKVLDIRNPLNYKVKNIYIDAGKNYISHILLDEQTKKFFVTFARPSSIGVVKY